MALGIGWATRGMFWVGGERTGELVSDVQHYTLRIEGMGFWHLRLGVIVSRHGTNIREQL